MLRCIPLNRLPLKQSPEKPTCPFKKSGWKTTSLLFEVPPVAFSSQENQSNAIFRMNFQVVHGPAGHIFVPEGYCWVSCWQKTSDENDGKSRR